MELRKIPRCWPLTTWKLWKMVIFFMYQTAKKIQLFRSFGLTAVSTVRIPPRWLCIYMPRDPTMTNLPNLHGENTFKPVLFQRSAGWCPTHATHAGSRMSPLPFAHLPGNMWAARCSYISKLIEPKLFESAMEVVLEERNDEPDTCPPPGGLADNCYGVGRFSNEHWILSHPEAQPCDLDSSSKYEWGEPTVHQFLSMNGFVQNVKRELLQPAPRRDMSAYQDVAACRTCGLDVSERLKEYSILYRQEPPATWWGWKFFESKLWHFISETGAAWGKNIPISSWYFPIYQGLKRGQVPTDRINSAIVQMDSWWLWLLSNSHGSDSPTSIYWQTSCWTASLLSMAISGT